MVTVIFYNIILILIISLIYFTKKLNSYRYHISIYEVWGMGSYTFKIIFKYHAIKFQNSRQPKVYNIIYKCTINLLCVKFCGFLHFCQISELNTTWLNSAVGWVGSESLIEGECSFRYGA